MKQKKVIGVCMDHSIARLIEQMNDEVITKIISSDFNHHEKNSISKNESLMHNKEQNHQLNYYKRITEAINDFDEILLFGATEAKNELLNLLKSNRNFEFKKMEAITVDKMTENQQEAFVKKYFATVFLNK